MLGVKSLTYQPPNRIPTISRPISNPLHTRISNVKTAKSTLLIFAQNNNDVSKEPQKAVNQEQPKNGGDDEDGKRKDALPLFNLKLGDLLDPDPDNILAVGLTGLLTWASVQVLSQLFFISLAILVAALKYSFVAALLIFILITLL